MLTTARPRPAAPPPGILADRVLANDDGGALPRALVAMAARQTVRGDDEAADWSDRLGAASCAMATLLLRARPAAARPELLFATAIAATTAAPIWAANACYSDALGDLPPMPEWPADQSVASLWHEMAECLVEAMLAEPVFAARLPAVETELRHADADAAEELLRPLLLDFLRYRGNPAPMRPTLSRLAA